MRARILNASAGSGKTYQLAYKYVRDTVENPERYRHILAVTFTNKATEEMKRRILKEIHALASGAPSGYLEDLCRELRLDAATVRRRAREVRSRILHDYSRFTVLTIDTFFQRILRAFIKELGMDLDYNVEIETASVLTRSADTLVERITVDEELRRWLTEFVEERIAEGRKWDIRDGILALGGELFKERNKEALSAARPREELARIVREATSRAERTRQQMRELAESAVRLIADAGCTAADFAGKSRSFANYFYAVAAEGPKPYTATVAKRAASTDGWCAAGSPAAPLVGALQPLLRRMCALYDDNLRQWNTSDLIRENYRSFALLADLYAQVQRMCDEQNTMLLSETKYLLSEFIGRNDAPFIYEKVGNRFDCFMIDEFQDTSEREWENFLPLLHNAMAQSTATSVVLVGDIKQSIYRWRGGDWRILRAGAAEALGTDDTEVVDLRENWRSLPAVVAFNNAAIARIVESDNRELNRTLDEAAARGEVSAPTAETLRDTLADAYRDHAQQPRRRNAGEGYVAIETFAERPPVVERICRLIDTGFRPADILVLVRSATDGAKVAAELLDFKQRNAEERYRFDVMTQEALVVGRAPVCAFVTAALRLALNPADKLHRALYNQYLGRPFDRPLDDDERAFFRTLRLHAPEEAFERIVMRYDLQHRPAETAYLQALHEQIIAFGANRIADIPLFLRWWDEQGSRRSLTTERSERAVEITTVHKAKGLERRAVVIPWCSWPLDPRASGVQNIVWAEARDGEAAAVGRFPVRYRKAMAESGFSEEYYRELVYTHVDNVNLLYVALTRAAESLHVFIPQRSARTVGGLLLQNLAAEQGRVRIGDAEGRYERTEAGERFEFGTFAGPAPGGREEGAEHAVVRDYPTSPVRLRLRLPSQRYFEQGERELSPRNFGILMHKAFECATSEADIRGAVERMQADGSLDAAQAQQLREAIDRALEHPAAREWFGDGWDEVRNENEIVVPGSGSVRRPDRVMLRGRRAVAVDYKFGAPEPQRYARQIGDYLALLRGMGYTETEGYVWYVALGRIERVE
ncbi:exodeoxyribonuclease V subunit beta [uncultured Alistipes sp.]|uniref:UvrD-helicase domain-containing protein n=1 Tax=uncultured Alistipes sp. TaxID=538949 RepID=UPI002619ED95|nr:UvrD-helicase domain-containing protein [uncultured Alistipes sp.]